MPVSRFQPIHAVASAGSPPRSSPSRAPSSASSRPPRPWCPEGGPPPSTGRRPDDLTAIGATAGDGERRRRGSASSTSSPASTAGASRSSARSATRSRSRPRPSATATTRSGVVVRYLPPQGGGWREAPMTWIDREVDGDRWVGSFEVDAVGHWAYEVGAFTDHFATWHDEVTRKRAAGGEDLTSEVAEGALLLRDTAAPGQRRRRRADRRRARRDRGPGDRARGEARPGPRRRPARRGRAPSRPRRLHHLRSAARRRRRARARPLRLLVRALPALLGRLRRRPARSCRGSPSSAST